MDEIKKLPCNKHIAIFLPKLIRELVHLITNAITLFIYKCPIQLEIGINKVKLLYWVGGASIRGLLYYL